MDERNNHFDFNFILTGYQKWKVIFKYWAVYLTYYNA